MKKPSAELKSIPTADDSKACGEFCIDDSADANQPQHKGDKKLSCSVYVLSYEGVPLMPTSPCKAKHLLKQGKAKVVKKAPFVIKLSAPLKVNRNQKENLRIDQGISILNNKTSREIKINKIKVQKIPNNEKPIIKSKENKMSCREEIYVDGIGKLHFVKGMVRFDLISYEPGESGQEPGINEKQRIIMPPDGFLATFNTMQRLIDQLVEAGVLKKTEPVRK